jgi:YcaO-like protein with predicted kinase domain
MDHSEERPSITSVSAASAPPPPGPPPVFDDANMGGLPRAELDPQPISFRGREFRSSKAFRCGTHRARDPAKTFREIKPYLARAGVTRIADVTGLDRVGVPTTLALRPNAETMACSSGKGVTLDQANVSGAMEAFELHAAEIADVASFRASYKETSKLFEVPAVDSLPLTSWSLFNVSVPLYWHAAWDIAAQCEVAVPLALVGMSLGRGYIPTAGWFNVSSNGLGAGNSFLEAIAAGLYEVVERDAIACRYYVRVRTGMPFPVLTDDLLHSFPLVSGVMAACDRAGVRMVVEDCTVDSTVPTYYAIAHDVEDRGVCVVCGSGAHLDPEIAILRAVTEALQARLNFIAGSRDDIFRTAFVRLQAKFATIVKQIHDQRKTAPQAIRRASGAADTFEEDLLTLLSRLRSVGLEQVLVVDLTPSDCPVHVVRVIVPGAEGYLHHGYSPGKRAKRYLQGAPV